MISVLKDCGESTKRVAFLDHVKASALIKMISYCNNVTELCLSPMTKLDSKRFDIAAKLMEHLERLEVQLSTDIKPLLQMGKLRVLTVAKCGIKTANPTILYIKCVRMGSKCFCTM